MIEPWFNPNAYSWLPGAVLGSVVGLMGALAGCLVPRGKGRPLVLGGIGLLLAAGAVCLILGVYALLVHQPYGVWYGFLLPGVLGLGILGPATPLILMGYREAENRKMKAQDL